MPKSGRIGPEAAYDLRKQEGRFPGFVVYCVALVEAGFAKKDEMVWF